MSAGSIKEGRKTFLKRLSVSVYVHRSSKQTLVRKLSYKFFWPGRHSYEKHLKHNQNSKLTIA